MKTLNIRLAKAGQFEAGSKQLKFNITAEDTVFVLEGGSVLTCVFQKTRVFCRLFKVMKR